MERLGKRQAGRRILPARQAQAFSLLLALGLFCSWGWLTWAFLIFFLGGIGDVVQFGDRHRQRQPPEAMEAAPDTGACAMTWDKVVVDLVGLALIGFIVWFFWLVKAEGVKAALTSAGTRSRWCSSKGAIRPT